MPTTGVINSTLMRVYVDVGGTPTAIACATDAQISFSSATRDTTCKDSGSWRDILYSFKSATVSTSGLYKDDSAPADAGFLDLYDDWDAQTTVTIRFTTNVSGDYYFEADAIITSLELNSAGVDENVTYSATFEITGAITKAALT